VSVSFAQGDELMLKGGFPSAIASFDAWARRTLPGMGKEIFTVMGAIFASLKFEMGMVGFAGSRTDERDVSG
jgi:hypothetical protein